VNDPAVYLVWCSAAR